MFARFNLVDNVPAVILFMTATSLPFGIWLMKGFMDGVPLDLEQAAWVDGATWVKSLRLHRGAVDDARHRRHHHLYLRHPVGKFLRPVHPPPEHQQAPGVGRIYQFFSQYGQADYGQLAAFSILYTLPAGDALDRDWPGSCGAISLSPAQSKADRGGISVHDDRQKTEDRVRHALDARLRPRAPDATIPATFPHSRPVAPLP